VSDRLRGRRYGDLQALKDIVRLNNALGAVHLSGGEVVEPTDVPVDLRPVHMALAHITEGDLVWAARGIGRRPVEDALAMAAISRGVSLDDLARAPLALRRDQHQLPPEARRGTSRRRHDGGRARAGGRGHALHARGRHGAHHAGRRARAPDGRGHGVIALTQMVRPGAPAVYGGFTSNVDMRSGSPAFGTPEYVRATLAGGQVARRLGVPYRTSSVNSSTSVDAQAAYETQFSLFAAVMAHGNLINHSTGWLESGLTTSLEKIVVDTEMLRGWAASLAPIEASPSDLAVEAVLEVPPGGHFFGSSHTMSRFETAFNRPLVSDWTNWETWREKGSQDAAERATAIWQRVLAEYEPPALDPGVREALEDHVARRTREAEGP
jgi:trimethylamine--corrinoid protein Co-methyltransferase